MGDQELVDPLDLFEAVSKGLLTEVREKLEAGDWDVNGDHMMSRTALHIAATRSNVHAVKLLLEFHPDVKVRVYPAAVRPRVDKFSFSVES